MKITIETISHQDQRYPTVGDWFYSKAGDLNIKVSQMNDEDMELLVAFHELVEAILCKANGVTQEQVDEYDMNFAGDGEPGDADSAPYHDEHVLAECLERLLAQEMGVRWRHYEDAIAELG